LRAAFNACPAGLAVVENGRIFHADPAFGVTLQLPCSSKLRGRLLTDLLPQNTRYLDLEKSQFNVVQFPVEIEALTSTFEENDRVFQVVCIHSVPRRDSSVLSAWESKKMERIGLLSAEFTHDLNNMLMELMLYTDCSAQGLSQIAPYAATPKQSPRLARMDSPRSNNL
jgi:hypothetical protein